MEWSMPDTEMQQFRNLRETLNRDYPGTPGKKKQYIFLLKYCMNMYDVIIFYPQVLPRGVKNQRE